MARVNVEQKALTDPRFDLLGKLMNSNRFEALGRMLLVWHECQERGSYMLPVKLVGVILGSPDAAGWLVESDLAELHGDAEVRVKGTEGRIEWLEARRTQARRNGKTGGRPKNQQETKNEPTLVSSRTKNEPTLDASGFPTETPLTPAPAPAPPPSGGAGGGDSEIVPIPPFSDFTAAWTEADLPGSAERTSTRVGWWQFRIRDDRWRRDWRNAVSRAGKSVRCRGETAAWPGGLTVKAFLENEDMLIRILDGEFDNAEYKRPPPEPTKFIDPNDIPTNRTAPPRKAPEAA